MDDCKNTDGKITRFSVIPSVIMINKNLIGDIKIRGYEDLLKPELKRRLQENWSTRKTTFIQKYQEERRRLEIKWVI